MFQFAGFPSTRYGFARGCAGASCAGFPIQTPADLWVCAPPRGFSQLVASFIGPQCQGIRPAPLPAWPTRRVASRPWPRLLLVACCFLSSLVVISFNLVDWMSPIWPPPYGLSFTVCGFQGASWPPGQPQRGRAFPFRPVIAQGPMPRLGVHGLSLSFCVLFDLLRQPPALPRRPQRSTIGRPGLNPRVRDGHACCPWAHRHRIPSWAPSGLPR